MFNLLPSCFPCGFRTITPFYVLMSPLWNMNAYLCFPLHTGNMWLVEFFFFILLAITERKILPKYTDEAIFINVEPYYSFGIIENGRICFSFCKNYEHLRPRAECVNVGYRSVESLKCSGIGNLVQNVMILWVNNTFNWWPNEL